MEEIIYKIKALPHAGINESGDCGPCCVGSISRKSVREIYDLFVEIPSGVCYGDIIMLLNKLGIEYENYLPSDRHWAENPEFFPIGKPSWRNWISWYELSQTRLRRGMIGIAPVNMKGELNITDYINHFVLIVGFKQTGDSASDKKVLISCPTKGDFEIQPKDFLWHYGGYNAIWVKPLYQ